MNRRRPHASIGSGSRSIMEVEGAKIELDENLAEGWAAVLSSAPGRSDQATAFARRVVELDPLSITAHLSLGRKLKERGTITSGTWTAEPSKAS